MKHSSSCQPSYRLNNAQLEWVISTYFHPVQALRGLHKKKRQSLRYSIGSLYFLLFRFRLIVLGKPQRVLKGVSAHFMAWLLLKWNWCFINNFKVTNISLTITAIQWYSFGISQFHFCVLFIRNGLKSRVSLNFSCHGLTGDSGHVLHLHTSDSAWQQK